MSQEKLIEVLHKVTVLNDSLQVIVEETEKIDDVIAVISPRLENLERLGILSDSSRASLLTVCRVTQNQIKVIRSTLVEALKGKLRLVDAGIETMAEKDGVS